MKQLLDFLDNMFANMWQPLGPLQPAYAHNFKVQAQEPVSEKLKNIVFKKGGTTVVETPTYTPPPPAPAPAAAATQEAAMTPEEEAALKLEAQKSGASSLQIPVTGGASANSAAQVGTGT